MTNPRRLLRVRATPNGADVRSARSADLSKTEWEDLRRYLDATRSELAFAKSAILVEGFAEQVLLQRMSADHDFDEAGLTVCAIHGTHFTSYVKFVRALGIPYSVITDGDPDLKNSLTGAERVAKLCHSLGVDASDAEAEGIFIGDVTLEVDLFVESDDNRRSMVEALKSMLKSAAAATVEEAWSSGTFEAVDLLRRVRGRKGLFAQRLAGLAGPLSAPGYIQKAFDHLRS